MAFQQERRALGKLKSVRGTRMAIRMAKMGVGKLKTAAAKQIRPNPGSLETHQGLAAAGLGGAEAAIGTPSISQSATSVHFA